MLPAYIILDLETTGATPLRDRITEIALIRYEKGEEVARWETLVNPEQPIPPFIQQLTGIDNEMVAKAPLFSEVADTLLSYLEGAVLCAHNVRFDHGFLKAEFKRIGITLRQKVLCTVKISRLLYLGFPSHGLDAIMRRHGITTIARHRAMGDVETVAAFLQIAENELGAARVKAAAAQLMQAPTLPVHIDAAMLEDMPESPGVYLFYGENSLPLYIGKSINIRARVLSHFSSDHASTKEMRIGQEVKHVEWIETAGDFSALLLESKLVKERQPIHNRQLRHERQLCSWRLNPEPTAHSLVELVREDDMQAEDLASLYGTFRTKKQAVEVLRKLAEVHALCPKYLGLEAWSKGACFSSQIKRCKGVCCGNESHAIHHIRLQTALMKHKIKTWPFAGKIGIREKSRVNNMTQIHIFEHWCMLGSVNHEDELHDVLSIRTNFKFDLDTYKLLIKILNHKNTQLIDYAKLAA